MGRAITVGILLIGEEILSGKIEDKNAALLIRELRALGASVREVRIVADDKPAIIEAVRALSSRYDHVFTSGGVGPTHDDVTMPAIAEAFDSRIVRHPRLEGILRGHYGEKLFERDLIMADVPDKAHFIDAQGLSWPVIAVENVYILPGVPQIFAKKFLAIKERFRADPFSLAMVFVRVDEGAIAAHLDAVVAQFGNVSVGSYPVLDEPTYRVKVTLESKDAEAVRAATSVLVERLGDSVVRVQAS